MFKRSLLSNKVSVNTAVYAGIQYKPVVEISLPIAKQLGDKVADIKLVK